MSDKITIECAKYSAIRDQIHVGDGWASRGGRIVSRAIRIARPGLYDFSHWSTVIRDTRLSVDGHVKVFEFLGGGPRHSYTSKAYQRDHGELFWIPMQATKEQQFKMIRAASALERGGVKYDFGSTWFAWLIGRINIDAQKFNCSEVGWWLWRQAKLVNPLLTDKFLEWAPLPGDMPLYAKAKRIVQIEMDI